MDEPTGAPTFRRRTVLAAGVLSVTALPGFALAQQTKNAADSPSPATPAKRPVGVEKPSRTIAEFVVGFDLRTAPPLAIQRARLAFIDTVGVMLAGTRMPAADIVCRMVTAEGAAPTVSVVGRALRTSPQLAALANGVASHGMDYDFTYLMGQSAAPVIPALLPLAEKVGATPSEVLSSFVVGLEVASRICRATPTLSAIGGWHSTSTIGTIATAAACARLLKTPASAIPDVIGIAVSMASGVSVNYGTMTKPLHAGHAARNGMVAALLGGDGFTANGSALEAGAGFFKTFARGLDWSLEPFGDLGRIYDIVERGYTLKRYPCGGHSHTAIDAVLELRDELGPRVRDITSVKVGLSKSSAQKISNDYPQSVENAKFSAPYLIAYTLLHGAPLLPAFADAAIDDAGVRAFATRVSSSVDHQYANALELDPARVVISLSNGQTLERVKEYAIGSTKIPMTDGQVREKFLACASPTVNEKTALQIHAALGNLGDQPTFADFWPLVRGS
jgi:2-methylcitrate dehydratase PrpD